MRTSDFDYELPPERIASRPAVPRDAAKLLVVPRGGGTLEDRTVADLPALLDPGDLLVVNDTRVIPARLAGRRADTGGAVEVFLVRDLGERRWLALLSPGRRMRTGVRVDLGEGVSCTVERIADGGARVVQFEGGDDVLAFAGRRGATPLPPYIRRPADARDVDDYQTAFARVPGAVAAPTAGLHFTPALLARLGERGISVAPVTLHVGPATFRPVTTEDPAEHRLDPERFEVPAATTEAIASARARGHRVVAVGTTVVRTLESAATSGGRVAAGPGETTLFVRPGHRFAVVDALLTNFHLPRSSLLMLVAAFASRDVVMAAYAHAMANGYRFYSYGDAML